MHISGTYALYSTFLENAGYGTTLQEEYVYRISLNKHPRSNKCPSSNKGSPPWPKYQGGVPPPPPSLITFLIVGIPGKSVLSFY